MVQVKLGDRTMSKLDFAALLCSRLCHDLVSPVGAINNGLELLGNERDAAMRDAVIDLIEKSTEQTSNKLQFFRLAFGAAGGFSAHLDTREAEKSLRAFLAGSRIDLNWVVGVSELSKGGVKLLLNVCLVVAETMIRGGTLDVSFQETESNTLLLSVRGTGDRVIFAESVRAALTGQIDEADLEPRAAPAHLAFLVAQELGGQLALGATSDTELTITAAIQAQV